ncbi:MAG: sigma-70 factor domain-containing protein, partial [Gemmatimonadaceae bacterium]
MQQVTEGRAKTARPEGTTSTSNSPPPRALGRAFPATAYDQYLQDIQRLPLITDPEEERRLARRAQKGDETAAERLVTANLRFVSSYGKK